MHPGVEEIPFDRWVAAGNDFIILDDRDGRWTDLAPALARKLCHRRLSVGADGLILVGSSRKAHVRARFFNPDGTEFNMCMNGTRCVARYALHHVIAPRRMTIETAIGVIEAVVDYRTVHLSFYRAYEVRLRQRLTFRDRTISAHWVRVGDPHLVLFVQDVRSLDLARLAPAFRSHPDLGPEGANVNFVHVIEPGRIDIRTYERGVEAETLSCGSGCVSTALVLAHLGHRWDTYRFHTRSGSDLVVRLEWAGSTLRAIHLSGEARRVCQGILTPEAWEYDPPRD
jgi:diaminopimelate epimerase